MIIHWRLRFAYFIACALAGGLMGPLILTFVLSFGVRLEPAAYYAFFCCMPFLLVPLIRFFRAGQSEKDGWRVTMAGLAYFMIGQLILGVFSLEVLLPAVLSAATGAWVYNWAGPII